jgi:hypothetical protein
MCFDCDFHVLTSKNDIYDDVNGISLLQLIPLTYRSAAFSAAFTAFVAFTTLAFRFFRHSYHLALFWI